MKAKEKGRVRESGLVLKVGLGLDLDCGRTTKQPEGMGADIAATPGGTRLAVSASDPRAGAAWLDGLALNDFSRCARLPDASYRRSLDGLDKPLVDGRNICIRTGEHNIAIVRLDEPSTADAPGLDLHYAIQYQAR